MVILKIPLREFLRFINKFINSLDPKVKRATRRGWVDPKRKANSDPKKRSGNLGRDLTEGLVDQDPDIARPKRSTNTKSKKAGN